MTSATATPRETDERQDTDRHLPASNQTLASLPMFEAAQLASMRGSISPVAGTQEESDAESRAGWLRLDE